ncbi:BglG family transcription antiterminator LicT [Vagococcus lutrae]|uniref:BglG family transcription antiterminator LicT n=1 Tax=Vagococcus lutrae TaxID=81947 RepID=UPI00288DEDF0|nr:PRD domain-containing protein [Vagococcus lutrae]MDT2825434.1 PRD domain-containing protein [Vagococcus lutrae]
MRIVKVLNNNVIIALNEDAEEVILMGNGLGFQMKTESTVRTEKIEKVFKLENKVEKEQVEKIFSEIPEDIIQVSYEVISYAKKKLDKELKDSAFVAVADHLYSAIHRDRKGVQVKNFLLWDIKRFFPDELSIGQKAIDMVNEKFNTNLLEDEAGFIALHITNASLDSGYEDAVSLTQLIEEILTVIKYTLRVDFTENDIYFQRFITHLKFFSQRVLMNQTEIDEGNQVENDLFSLVTKQYPEAFEVTKKVSDFLKSRRNYTISKDEQVYFTIHLARIIDKTKS